MGGISFKKGCYTGQETVARAKYRGINKRAMYIVSGDCPLALNAQQPITLERSVGENWRKAGELMHCYQFSDQQALRPDGVAKRPRSRRQNFASRAA